MCGQDEDPKVRTEGGAPKWGQEEEPQSEVAEQSSESMEVEGVSNSAILSLDKAVQEHLRRRGNWRDLGCRARSNTERCRLYYGRLELGPSHPHCRLLVLLLVQTPGDASQQFGTFRGKSSVDGADKGSEIPMWGHPFFILPSLLVLLPPEKNARGNAFIEICARIHYRDIQEGVPLRSKNPPNFYVSPCFGVTGRGAL